MQVRLHYPQVDGDWIRCYKRGQVVVQYELLWEGKWCTVEKVAQAFGMKKRGFMKRVRAAVLGRITKEEALRPNNMHLATMHKPGAAQTVRPYAVMYEGLEWTVGDIAFETGVTPSTIRRRLADMRQGRITLEEVFTPLRSKGGAKVCTPLTIDDDWYRALCMPWTLHGRRKHAKN